MASKFGGVAVEEKTSGGSRFGGVPVDVSPSIRQNYNADPTWFDKINEGATGNILAPSQGRDDDPISRVVKGVGSSLERTTKAWADALSLNPSDTTAAEMIPLLGPAAVDAVRMMSTPGQGFQGIGAAGALLAPAVAGELAARPAAAPKPPPSGPRPPPLSSPVNVGSLMKMARTGKDILQVLKSPNPSTKLSALGRLFEQFASEVTPIEAPPAPTVVEAPPPVASGTPVRPPLRGKQFGTFNDPAAPPLPAGVQPSGPVRPPVAAAAPAEMPALQQITEWLANRDGQTASRFTDPVVSEAPITKQTLGDIMDRLMKNRKVPAEVPPATVPAEVPPAAVETLVAPSVTEAPALKVIRWQRSNGPAEVGPSGATFYLEDNAGARSGRNPYAGSRESIGSGGKSLVETKISPKNILQVDYEQPPGSPPKQLGTQILEKLSPLKRNEIESVVGNAELGSDNLAYLSEELGIPENTLHDAIVRGRSAGYDETGVTDAIAVELLKKNGYDAAAQVSKDPNHLLEVMHIPKLSVVETAPVSKASPIQNKVAAGKPVTAATLMEEVAKPDSFQELRDMIKERAGKKVPPFDWTDEAQFQEYQKALVEESNIYGNNRTTMADRVTRFMKKNGIEPTDSGIVRALNESAEDIAVSPTTGLKRPSFNAADHEVLFDMIKDRMETPTAGAKPVASPPSTPPKPAPKPRNKGQNTVAETVAERNRKYDEVIEKRRDLVRSAEPDASLKLSPEYGNATQRLLSRFRETHPALADAAIDKAVQEASAIAKMDGASEIRSKHLAESLQYLDYDSSKAPLYAVTKPPQASLNRTTVGKLMGKVKK